MNDRPPETIQEMMSDEDFAMIVQSIDVHSAEYRSGRARRIAALNEIFGLWASRTDIPKDGLEYQRLMRKEWE